MDKLLANKVAIVIGGGQRPGEKVGNGRAISLLLAKNGAKVMVVDMFLDRAQDTVKMIAEQGGEAFAHEADIVNEDQCREIAKVCVDKYGRIDILVNNAGIVPNEDTGIETTPVEVWDRVMNVNLRGPLLCSRYVLPIMVSQGSGSIVNISSSSAFMCGPTPGKKGNVAYPVSKYALNFLGEIMAIQYAADGIRVNTVVPGIMDTPIGIEPSVERGMDRQQVYESRNKRVPLKGGMGDAWDIAEAVLFLVSEKAKHVTGATFPVAGGVTIKRG